MFCVRNLVSSLGLAWCLGVLSSLVEAQQSFTLGDNTVESAVHFREIDSFWRGNASHLDLYNVKLEMQPGGSNIGDMVLKIFIEDEVKRERIRSRFDQDLQLLSFKKASMALQTPSVEFVSSGAQKLDPNSCDQVWDGSVFFDSPWYHNVFHLHAKNILPTALVIATAPSLIPGVPACTELPCEAQLPKRTLIHYVADQTSKPLLLSNVQLAMFDKVLDISSITDGQSHCFRHLNWGYGGELTSVDGFRAEYVHETRVLTQEVRKFAIRKFVTDVKMQDKLLTVVQDRMSATPRVLWISRQPKDTKGMVQTGRNRWIQDPDVVKAAWAAAGANVDECCDWNKVTMESMMTKIADADIVFGLHGAGLGNALYSHKGSVLVEIVGNYGGDSLFYNRIAAATYGDWLRVRVPKNNKVGATMAKYFADCAVSLWRGSENWQDICDRDTGHYNGRPAELVRTTQDMLKIGTAEELPLVVEIAECDASPRCRMAKLKQEHASKGNGKDDMIAIMKAMASRPKAKPPARGSGAPGRNKHRGL